MSKRKTKDEHEEVETGNGQSEYVLRLFVTGASPNSSRAVTNLKNICEANIPGKYSLEIIDVYQSDDIARTEGLIALPMLVKKLPLPERKLIGDMSDTKKVLTGLGIIP